MDTLSTLWNAVFPNLVSEFIVVVAGVLFAQIVYSRWERYKYGKWRVIIKRQGKSLLDRHISPRKAHEILEEPAELSVFLKGVISPYAWVTCDLVENGGTIGLLNVDSSNRRYIVNLDNNPKKKSAPPNTAVIAEIKQLAERIEEYFATE